ncbi:MAG: hypothetical protein MJY58_02205 [Bacteroidaceae bacterium]|nr:hypothetical protein [Bacteroidaceae bacterium]
MGMHLDIKTCPGLFIPVIVICIFLTGCSTSKNTAGTRLYHATVTRYNTYFNGKEAYRKGYESQEQAMKTNWLEYPEINPASDSKTKGTGAANYETAITKAKKCIRLHSISAKPKKKSGKTLSDKDKQWYAKTEYNPFLWNAWMLMADAQAQSEEFIEAASTYSYIAGMYADEPEIVAEAIGKMAWCYAHVDWFYEADELFSRTNGLKTGIQKQMELKALRASALMRQSRYEECIPLMEDAINRKDVGKSQRIRERYLLGQLYKTEGRFADAERCFRQVIRMNPSYDIEFHARIRQTETMASGQGSRKAMRKLEHMLKDSKNKTRQDQVYYAMGNIKLLNNDTIAAIRLFEQGAKANSNYSPEKGILLLTLADLYWNMSDYANAGRCYSNAVGMIGTAHKEYKTVRRKSEVLEELASELSVVHMQDSLQWLATLPDSMVTGIIDKVIEELKQKEEQQEQAKTGDNEETDNKTVPQNDNQTASWYFYNSQAVERGKDEFMKQWGNRALEDDWRRSNKSVLAADPTENNTKSNGDDMNAAADTSGVSDAISADSLPDRYSRQYYLNMIPYSQEAMIKSDNAITRSLFSAGIIFKDELAEYTLAEEKLWRIVNSYPNSQEADNALYQLFLLYSHIERKEMADSCTAILSRLYKDSEYTMMLTDSNYIDNARFGRQREDSIYAMTYQAFRDGDAALVNQGCQTSAMLYPMGQNRARFMFLHAAIQLQNGNLTEFLSELKELVSKYPQEEISQFAGIIAQGVQDGRILQSSNMFSIWERSGTEGQMPDSLKPSFNNDRFVPFQFIIAYPDGELNENQLLFELANYNFSNYTMRDFNLKLSKQQGIGMLSAGEFINFDEAYIYSRKLFADPEMARKFEGLKVLVISESNLETLFKYYSINEWQTFYEENFLNIPQFELDGSTLYEALERDTEIQAPES